MTHKVFVYGTLKEGQSNHRLLNRSLFTGRDAAPGILYTGPAFPMAIEIGSLTGDPVVPMINGELYEVDDNTLENLDRLEGHPDFYERKEVTLESGQIAWIYYWQGEIERLRFIPQGEWPA